MVQCQLYDISGFYELEILNVCMEYQHKQGPDKDGFYRKTQPQLLTMQPEYINMGNRTLQPF